VSVPLPLKTLETEAFMSMLERGNRAWTVKLRKKFQDMKTELRNHIFVHENMSRLWCDATDHFKTEAHANGDRRYKSLPCPCIPKLEEKPIAYQCCYHHVLPTGLVMEYIPLVLPDHVRALANSYIDPSVLESVKNDPNVENVRFLLLLGEELPLTRR
jgi:hypothetical protein